jgi:hypothetical protein
MGIKQVPTSLVLKYFESLGLIHKRTSASHFIYDFPDSHPGGSLMRPLPIHRFEKDVPLFHLHTCLKTLGISKSAFETWMKSQNKGLKTSRKVKPHQPDSDLKEEEDSKTD